MHGGKPSISDRNNPGVRAFAQALETVWGKSPFFKREGGSIPVVATMQDKLGIESVIGGFGLPDDNYHAPNEKLHLPTWYLGIEALIHFFMNLRTGKDNISRLQGLIRKIMEDRLISYGGQAVIEGVLMRGRKACAMANRKPDGSIELTRIPLGNFYQSKSNQKSPS